jgi:16S rRNA (uracil1498-N3)-methyltransferase
MRLHRFYRVQPLGEDVVINDVSLIKQWSKVFRYKEGDFVILFNGEGSDVTYRIETISLHECFLRQTNIHDTYIPSKKINIHLSLIKKDNFELVVQKATELGVTTITPVLSERSEKKNLNLERLRIIAVEAAEQCGRGDVPTILPIVSLSSALDSIPVDEYTYILQIDSTSFSTQILHDAKEAKSVNLFIGPEGGWSDQELNIFKKKNVTTVSLGKTMLRAETAAIISCAYAGL